ncbi:uncharacterized protein PV06_01535 [Exophiala oligosperma]|uniref:EF-hand domain-containing protein n=2 Tax=Chaetothyriales TaxID=34395 RepID=A0A0D2ECX4_9EURO|nr:uncharacterized protein PV06_01535 [Exophiala oligosperma]KAJ9636480.1 hypothetical protein H2204_005313 [Knufia peltigerae]KIW45824.1 hypothetical protein PV06_01535 [Exophiala oligosperma]
MRISILAFVLTSVGLVASECCDQEKPDNVGQCLDGTYADYLGCCAYGPCNIFCCNCDGGCRQAPSRRSARDLAPWIGVAQRADSTCGLFQTENQCALDKFEALDTNQDSILTLGEVIDGVNVLRPLLGLNGIDNATLSKDVTALFNLFDTNHDGNLTLAEALTPQNM